MRILINSLLYALLLPFLLSCHTEVVPPSLKVGVNQWVGYEPLFLARNMGLYDDEKVKLVELSSSQDTLRLLREGVIDAGALTLDEVLDEVASGTPLAIVLLVDVSEGADAVIAQSEIDGVAALKGKTIGVENNAVGALLLNGLLKKGDLTAEDVRLVPLPYEKHRQAFKKKKVDALVTYSPLSYKLLAEGGVKLFDSSEMPNQIIDVVAVRKQVIEDRHESIAMLVSGFFDAVTFFETSKVQAVASMSGRLGSTTDEMMAAFQGLSLLNRQKNAALLGGESPVRQDAETIQDVLVNASLLEKKVDLPALFNADFVTGQVK